MSKTRDAILRRLRDNRPTNQPLPSPYRKPLGWDSEQRIASFTERMRAVRGDVYRTTPADWARTAAKLCEERGLKQALVGHGPIADQFVADASDSVDIRRYTQPVEEWKPTLFRAVDVAVTGCRAGLAESGSLVLWPDRNEPRLMSLVPPVHIAVLDAARLYENFAEMLAVEQWAAGGMPTNALLISGPSKTADIEQTLAYGIHGPKSLITLIVE